MRGGGRGRGGARGHMRGKRKARRERGVLLGGLKPTQSQCPRVDLTAVRGVEGGSGCSTCCL